MNPVPFFSWLEWLACLAVAVPAVFGIGNRRTAGILIAALALSWAFGTATWFLLPLAAGGVIRILMERLKNPWRTIGKYSAIGGAVATGLLCWVFPVPEPPPLTGNYQVGTFAMEIPAAGGSLRLMAQVWYPAENPGEKSAVAWLPDRGLVPEFPYHRLAFAKTHARLDAPVAAIQGLLPVVFYEHSWLGNRFENIAQVESLASRGLVVVAVDHPGQAGRILYPDGAVVNGRFPEPLDFSSTRSVSEFEANAGRCFTERLGNVERVRQALGGNIAKNLAGRLRNDHLGVFGFSFGGSTAVRLCAENPAFTAGANEDGLFLGSEFPHGPFLFFDEEIPAWLEAARKPGENAGQILTREAESRIQEALKQPHRERMILDGTHHLAFSDRIFSSRLPRLARVGTRPANEVHALVCQRLGAFFIKELQPVNGF